MTSVADELALDQYLDSLSPMNRASIERAMRSRFHDDGAIERAYEHGYSTGVDDGLDRAKRAAEAATKKPSPPPAGAAG